MNSFFQNKKRPVLFEIDDSKIDHFFIQSPKEFLKNSTTSTTSLLSQCQSSIQDLGFNVRNEPMKTILVADKINIKHYITMIDLNRMCMPVKTTIPCFGCHRIFNTIPLGIPLKYIPSFTSIEDGIIENNNNSKEYFEVDGITCSFNCILRVIEDDSNNSLYRNSRLLVPLLYFKIFGIYPPKKIIPSPSWKLRELYGGPLNEEDYSKTLQQIEIVDSKQIDYITGTMRPQRHIFNVYDIV